MVSASLETLSNRDRQATSLRHEPRSGLTVGIDTGGTFTDFVVQRSGDARILEFKVPSTPQNPTAAIEAGLSNVLKRFPGVPVQRLVHGTTVATNQLIQGRPIRVALITTRGFRDVLEIGRQYRKNLYDMRNPGRPQPLVPRELRFDLNERISARGEVLKEVDQGEVRRLIERLVADGVEAVAVCFLHAFSNDANEVAVGRALREHFAYVCLSSEVDPELREYERTVTTVVNASLLPIMTTYLGELEARLDALRRDGLMDQVALIQSNGGALSLRAAQRLPVRTIMSGPAAGVAATQAVAQTLGLNKVITFDMGGTSTDVSLLVNGLPKMNGEVSAGDQPVRVYSVDVTSIGAGGGSIARITDAGTLRVGPESASAVPGPACYGLGGTLPTVTDANVVLGYIDQGAIFGDSINVRRELAEEAIAPIAKQFGMTLAQAAHAILQVATSTIERAVRRISVEHGQDPRAFTLLAFGGAGPLHACALAKNLGIRRLVVPAFSGVFSALGCIQTDERYDHVKTVFLPLSHERLEELRQALIALRDQTLADMKLDGYDPAAVQTRPSLDMRYAGQNYELTVALPDGALERMSYTEVVEAFHRAHRERYGFATDEPLLCVNIRITQVLQVERVDLPEHHPLDAATVASRRVFTSDGSEVEVPVHQYRTLPPGFELQGPCLVEVDSSSILIDSAFHGRVDRRGNILLEAR